MKKLALAACACVLLFTVSAVSQDRDRDRTQQQQTRSDRHVRTKNLNGWVRKDGDNYVFENDSDKERWNIRNSETIREHEGHHVQLNARVHDDDRTLEINKVNKRLRESKRDRDEHRRDDRH